MSHPRLSLALESADAIPASGRIALFRPTAATDLSDLPQPRLHAIQGFRPDYDSLVRRGIATDPAPEGPYVAAVVFLPRAKAEARALIETACEAVVPGGPVWIDGAKTDGIDSMLRDLRGRLPVSDPIAKAHGKIFRVEATPGALIDWRALAGEPAPGFTTLPGVFSAAGVDRGSALLAACLPETLPARIADLGAGWGWLSAQILARKGVERLDLVEAEHDALDCAKLNITDSRARFFWADATCFAFEDRYGGVVMNPPFHTTRAADPGLGLGFIRAAAGMLSLSGTLWMVSNRHLPYDPLLRELFHDVIEITPPGGTDPVFRITRAERPIAHATKPAAAPVAAVTRRRVSRARR